MSSNANQQHRLSPSDCKNDELFADEKSSLFEKRSDVSVICHSSSLHEPNVTLPLILSTENSQIVFDKPLEGETGIDDDFNIQADMFKTNSNERYESIFFDQTVKVSEKSPLTPIDCLAAQSTSLVNALDEKTSSFGQSLPITSEAKPQALHFDSDECFFKDSNISVRKKTPQLLSKQKIHNDEKLGNEVKEQSNFDTVMDFDENQLATETDVFNLEFSGNPSSSDSLFDDSLLAYSKSPSVDSGTEQKTVHENKPVLSKGSSLNTKKEDSGFVNVSDLNAALASVNLKALDNSNVSIKSKKQKKKKKGNHKSQIDIQSIEAEGYSLFELAKLVVKQARNATTSYLADTDEVSSGCSINRVLQLAAFQIGRYTKFL